MIDAAVGGIGIISVFEDWLGPHLDSGALEPLLEQWWPSFPGPYLYYPGRRYLPAPLRTFIDFVKQNDSTAYVRFPPHHPSQSPSIHQPSRDGR